MQVHVEFLMGLGGKVTSPGIIALSYQTTKLGPNYFAVVRAWDQWRDAGAAMKSLPSTTKRVIVGYSNGASEVTGVSDMGFQIDLLVALDPTIWLSCSPLHANVKEAICFHNSNPFSSFPPVGHATLTEAPDFDPSKQRLTIIETWDMHTSVDNDPVIQSVVMAAISKQGKAQT